MKEEEEPKPVRSWSVLFLLVFALGLATGYLFFIDSRSWSWENAAQFGDMFGGVNAIFSGTAIIAMAISIIQQSNVSKQQSKAITQQQESIDQQTHSINQQKAAIELQREDLKLQRADAKRTILELAKSADANTAAVDHMNKQAKIMKASACLPEIDRQLEDEYLKIHDPSNKPSDSAHTGHSEFYSSKQRLQRIKYDVVTEIENTKRELDNQDRHLKLLRAPAESLTVDETNNRIRSKEQQVQFIESKLELLITINNLQQLRQTMFGLLTNLNNDDIS